MVEQNGNKRGVRLRRSGSVTSKSGDKSVVVVVERRVRHPLYGKVILKSRKYHVHDAGNEAGVGDKVTIVECRPVSKLKHWRLLKIVESARTMGAAGR